MTYPLRSIRRYPVKAMGGEALTQVALDARGLVGDRGFAVVDVDGKFASGKNTRRFRRRDAVFEYAASTTADGSVQVQRGDHGLWLVGEEELDADLSERMGASVRALPERDIPMQDGGQISIVGTASLAWCAERFGIDSDPRRLRVNLVVETDEPFVEEGWLGREITVGDARLRVVERIERCRTVDVAQDGTTAEGRLLKPLTKEREMSLAVYADVVAPAVIRVGDGVGLAG
ncbi:MOSC domain-containing protein [Agromyces sp. H3Y2-19a]|uniref:MOSC domain-containing protein n=1 Tax=Agromyces TaxID=33877 RepID=UPI001E3115C7|nr:MULTISPECIES: MOSC N-terminal beta barrel domain-containing protein [Agromyces]MCD5345816.1 MOSC domain-containing protein [Agromyces sp. S2-1-8]MDF0512181.1 MOSC domain-containing protein [Agromyces chromiiresistens]